jgi:chromate transporter
MQTTTNSSGGQPVGLWQLVAYFLKLGSFGFGGPIALAGYMQRDLVPRGWITSEEYRQGLAFSQMMPGPLAAQLAMWIGFIRYGVIGASLVGVVFILPPYLLVVVIAAFYVKYNGLAIVQALFYGIGPAVIAIIAISAYKLARSTVEREVPLWVIFTVVGVITFVSRTEVALLFVAAGLVGILIYAPVWKKRRPSVQSVIFFATSALQITGSRLGELGAFFVKAGAFTFGSGLAIVPFLHQGVVLEYRWLTERQFLDAVAVGVITPGPVVITAAFVGYLVGGLIGSAVAAAAVFLPVYFFVLFIGRYIVKYRDHPMLKGFVKGATAAASGAIAGAAVILAEGSIIDLTTIFIAVASFVGLRRFKLPEPVIIAGAAVAGALLYRK